MAGWGTQKQNMRLKNDNSLALHQEPMMLSPLDETKKGRDAKRNGRRTLCCSGFCHEI